MPTKTPKWCTDVITALQARGYFAMLHDGPAVRFAFAREELAPGMFTLVRGGTITQQGKAYAVQTTAADKSFTKLPDAIKHILAHVAE